MPSLSERIEALWGGLDDIDPADPGVISTVHEAIDALDSGQVRVAEIGADGDVVVNEWCKYAILLLFKISRMETIEVGPFEYADKIPLKTDYASHGVRVVPGASSRWGSYLGPGVILMPSYVNLGAHVGANTMVDTWATVGSCAQIGANVHLSGGVGIGGVLEPPQAVPVIIEDEVFVGGNCGVYEGVIVGARAVLAPGVLLTGGVTVYDMVQEAIYRRSGPTPLMIPPGAVLVPGSRAGAGDFAVVHGVSLYAPVIVKYRDERTDTATSLEELLR